MPIKSRPEHTFRITGAFRGKRFDTEVDGTIADARGMAGQFETGMPGAARIQKWTGSGWMRVDRYERSSRDRTY